jgi:hypothetical protein
MSDEKTPTPPGGGWLSQLMAGVNLPTIIVGPAGNAISRLIAGAAEIPAAKFEQWAQQIRDRTKGKSIVNDAIASAVVDRAVADERLLDRAVESLIAKEYRKQSNKEAVARKTIEHLQDPPIPGPQQGRELRDIDNDWMNVFERHAENASSERLRDLWGRVLAGEIRRPGHFSLKTLSFIAELDEAVAKAFERITAEIVHDKYVPLHVGEADDILLLQEFGLLASVHVTFEIVSEDQINDPIIIRYRNHGIQVVLDETNREVFRIPPSIEVPAMHLTRVGQEIASILAPVDDIRHAEALAEFIRHDGTDLTYGIEAIYYGELVVSPPNQHSLLNPIEIWKSPLAVRR